MARTARIVVPEVPHHVTQRGVRSMSIFNTDRDRITYMTILSKMGKKYGIRICCWCLMENHIHLVAVPETRDSLARAIGIAHHTYTQMFNKTMGLKGHLFGERFYSAPMDWKHCQAVVRYIHRNPVRACLVERVEEYKWSSARYFLRKIYRDPLVNDDRLLNLTKNWDDVFASGMDIEELNQVRKTTLSGRPFGDESFITRVEELTGCDLSIKKQGRPWKNK